MSLFFVLDMSPSPTVDYILFLVADVTITPNLNEIRDLKYIPKAEQCEWYPFIICQ